MEAAIQVARLLVSLLSPATLAFTTMPFTNSSGLSRLMSRLRLQLPLMAAWSLSPSGFLRQVLRGNRHPSSTLTARTGTALLRPLTFGQYRMYSEQGLPTQQARLPSPTREARVLRLFKFQTSV